MQKRRPNPDQLLARVKGETLSERGKLKVYLGAAPGVGKTYSMLQDAKAKREQGLDVVAGVVETHGRVEIEKLLQDIEILPRRIVDYHNRPLLEFDIDAALARHPGLLLIDEMAHMNVPGLRHAKRWQDIKELLDRGVDVYTTLNVQHIESYNDIIAQIIGVKVRETVPDSMLALADTIELVDLPPDDLLKRLEEGKVYFPAQAEIATQHFFRKGNLIALRELALQYTAQRVDEQVLLHRQDEGIEQTWPTRERLLVCVGPETTSSKVVRAAKRMSAGLRAEWFAVFVETPGTRVEGKNAAVQNLRLAEQLGAQTRILTGMDIVRELITFAREHNVTKIVLGKQIFSRWRSIFYKNLADELIRASGEIDIYIVRGETGATHRPKGLYKQSSKTWWEYFKATAIVLSAVLVSFFLNPYFQLHTLSMVMLIAVIVISLQGYIGPAIYGALLSALAGVVFFAPSGINHLYEKPEYFITIAIMILIAYSISRLSQSNLLQAEITYSGEQRTSALQALTQQLATSRGTENILGIVTDNLSRIFDSDIIILLQDQDRLTVRASSSSNKNLNAKDMGVAQWVFDLGQTAGLGTDTLPFSDAVYVPLRGKEGQIGVIKVRPRDQQRLLFPEQLHLLETCANQIALSLEVDRLQDVDQKTQYTMETERLRKALLKSLSQELQSPLAGIVRLTNRLRTHHHELSENQELELIEDVSQESEQLNRLVNNLLRVTQLEEGKMHLQKKPHELAEVIKESLQRLQKRMGDRHIDIQIPDTLPRIPFDKVLMEEVFVNLIENALSFTPAETSIEIAANKEGETVVISISDYGPGISMDDIDQIFEKFYRGELAQQDMGSGLGLTICKSIIKAHEGRIWTQNRPKGGAAFYVVLPLPPT